MLGIHSFSMTILLPIVLLSALPVIADCMTCSPIPEVPASMIPNGFGPSFFDPMLGQEDRYACRNKSLIAQLETDGPIVLINYPVFTCIDTTWSCDESKTIPLLMSCITKPAGVSKFLVPSRNYVSRSNCKCPASCKYCPDNKQSILVDGTPFESITCTDSEYIVYLGDGLGVRIIAKEANVKLLIDCRELPTTTTTTVATTTTIKIRVRNTSIVSSFRALSHRPTGVERVRNKETITRIAHCASDKDTNPTLAQLWNVTYYYNYGVGVHAFCADQTCISAIQSNGIGYDMVKGKGLLGKAVSESAIGAVRSACPTGSQHLRNLGFTKSGKAYLHNLSGSGLKQGWVSISELACGAAVPIKRWKSRYTDDMMYGMDLESNTWYKGMVQDGGNVQFYMWK